MGGDAVVGDVGHARRGVEHADKGRGPPPGGLGAGMGLKDSGTRKEVAVGPQVVDVVDGRPLVDGGDGLPLVVGLA
jgi:hypothetical protein